MAFSLWLLLVAAQVPLEGPEAEEFLRSAEIIAWKPIPDGVTRPLRLELSDGERTLSASWKFVDIDGAGMTRLDDGKLDANFTDSYRSEIAAYALDQLLGLGLVPPTVERRFRGKPGALQMWVENAMSDAERQKNDVPIPDPLNWNRQVYNLQLFRQLTYDADYQNATNTLIAMNGDRWRIWAIDSSRAFRVEDTLFEQHHIDHFSRMMLRRLEALDFETLKAHLGRWISDDRIRALLIRRDLLVERAEDLVAQKGAEAVLVP